jgi:hypothetical protein
LRASLGTAIAVLLILLSATLLTGNQRAIENIRPRDAQTGGFIYASGWAGTAPTIDGTFSSKEWQSATAIPFNITYNIVPQTKPGVLYVMNDAQNLYLGIKVNDTDFNPGDVLEFFFDNNNTGVMTAGDKVLQYDVNALMTSHVGFFDEFLKDFGSGYLGRAEDRQFGGRTDGTGAGSGDGQYNYFEISYPLNSGDIGFDPAFKPGDTFGLLVRYDDNGGIGSYWPGTSPEVPVYAVRAQITLASPPPDFSISTNPANMTIQAGDTASSFIILRSINGFTGTVFLSTDSSNLSPSVDPPTVTLTNGQTRNSILTIRPGSTLSPGAYNITIVAGSGSVSHNATVQTRITAAPATAPRTLGLTLPVFYATAGAIAVVLALAISSSYLSRRKLRPPFNQ